MIDLGHLPRRDWLYEYLKHEIQPQLQGCSDPDYRVYRLNGSNDVYLYEERHTRTRMVGKFFFKNFGRNRETAARHRAREFHHLNLMRGYGFAAAPHYIARPLGYNPDLNELLVTECCYGELMSGVICRAIRTGDDGMLFRKLTALAWFLAEFHNRTANGQGVDFQADCGYGDGLVGALQQQRVIDANAGGELHRLVDDWRHRGVMYSDNQVLVHGDATPENFFVGDWPHVVSFDLERLHRDDRMFDVGRFAGELGHFFMLHTGDRGRAEPFIGHFLWEYACHFPDRERCFAAITRRAPFYMGITWLRIARNAWLNRDHRRRLAAAARECLRSQP